MKPPVLFPLMPLYVISLGPIRSLRLAQGLPDGRKPSGIVFPNVQIEWLKIIEKENVTVQYKVAKFKTLE